MGRGDVSKVLVLLILVLALAFSGSVIGKVFTGNISIDFPENNTYYTNGASGFNVTHSGENESYRGELLVNGTGYGYVNLTNGTTANVVPNASLDPGTNYTIQFNVTNGSQSALSYTWYFTIDAAGPSVDWLVAQYANNTYRGQDNIFLQGNTISDTHYANHTLYLTNASSGTVVNETYTTLTTNVDVNHTGLDDGNYTYNITVWDQAGNRAANQQRTITIDTTRPVPADDNTAANDSFVSGTSFTFNQSVTESNMANITYRLGNTSGLNPGNTSPAENVTVLYWDVNSNSSNFNDSITWAGLADGNYTYNVTYTDLANNVFLSFFGILLY